MKRKPRQTVTNNKVPPGNSFFFVNGTVWPEWPSYITRKADKELIDRLSTGEFCYILTTRQVGKSSLMVRVAKHLSETGVRTAIVDLTRIGSSIGSFTAEQWYYGIARKIHEELDIKGMEISTWWQSRVHLPALQRLSEYFSEVLEHTPERVVIFIDEIESTLKLPFTDDLFAAIRACYNARAEKASYRRLGFVLLGVASPADLMKDRARTPFNIGSRIDLTDFTPEEAQILAHALNSKTHDGAELLNRVFFWTNGHPYLTQKLCRLIEDGQKEASFTKEQVDNLVEQMFLYSKSTNEDYNLRFVREWITGNRKLYRQVLKLYENILYRELRGGNPISDQPLAPVYSHLKLSGLVSVCDDGTLSVRNRIYKEVFNINWVRNNKPSSLFVLEVISALIEKGLLAFVIILSLLLAILLRLDVTSLTSPSYTVSSYQALTLGVFLAVLGIYSFSFITKNPSQIPVRRIIWKAAGGLFMSMLTWLPLSMLAFFFLNKVAIVLGMSSIITGFLVGFLLPVFAHLAMQTVVIDHSWYNYRQFQRILSIYSLLQEATLLYVVKILNREERLISYEFEYSLGSLGAIAIDSLYAKCASRIVFELLDKEADNEKKKRVQKLYKVNNRSVKLKYLMHFLGVVNLKQQLDKEIILIQQSQLATKEQNG